MDELEKALAVLMGHANRDEIVALVQEKGRELWQSIFNTGHSTATQQGKKDRDKLEADLSTLKTQLDAEKKKVKDLEDKAPEVATIRKQYEDQIVDLKGQIDQRDVAEKKRQQDAALDRARTDLVGKLTTLRVNPAYAKSLIHEPEIAARLTLNDSGEVQVMQKGTNIPIIVSGGKSVLDVLAEELRTGVPKELILASGDRGTGGSEGGTAGGTPNLYDKIRESVKKEQEARSPSTGKEGAARLGLVER